MRPICCLVSLSFLGLHVNVTWTVAYVWFVISTSILRYLDCAHAANVEVPYVISSVAKVCC